MNEARFMLLVLAYASALSLGACSSAATRIYSLDPVAPRGRLDLYSAPPLRIDALSVPASWDRIEILRPSAGRLEISETDHWSAPLGQIARQALSADLDQRLPPGSVIFPRLPKPAVSLGVSVDILEFEVSNARASMRASWVIAPAAGTQPAKRTTVLFQDAAAFGDRAGFLQASTVTRIWSDLIGQLADNIAAEAASFQP